MASSTVQQNFICHFCSDEFRDRSLLLSHFSLCHIKTSTKRNDETLYTPQLNEIDRYILHILKLHQCNDKFVLSEQKNITNSNLQIPLSIRYVPFSKQLSFDDSMCSTTDSLLINNNHCEDKLLFNNFNNRTSLSYHIYKYSRRERKNFYASVKRARLKKQHGTVKKSRINSFIINKKENFRINLPTQINSRQRLNTNSNNSYPLMFDPNFNSLVQISTNKLFQKYFSYMNIYFHLIHSVASQEFQIIINSNDNQHHVSYTAFSLLNLLRQTMTDFSLNLQRNFKRNYFQSFQSNDEQSCQFRRYDQSVSSSSIIQMNAHHHHMETQTDNDLSLAAATSKFILIENNEINNSSIHPVQTNSNSIHYQRSRARTGTESILTSFLPTAEEQRVNRSPSPVLLKRQKTEPLQDDESNLSIDNPAIRLLNKSNIKTDENSLIKPTRMNTRKNSIKTETITETLSSFETRPVILSSNEISKEWSTHKVFYRCHACSHEEFFVVLSRECINLHISSKHGSMEENFKRQLSRFVNNKGHSLIIFQHYLKWQQPWPDKEIEKIFKLSNK